MFIFLLRTAGLGHGHSEPEENLGIEVVYSNGVVGVMSIGMATPSYYTRGLS